jgi:replicative DNA helicase
MSDLRSSGEIEQDADIIVMVYRDEYYNPESEDKGLAEFIVAKNRMGQTGFVKCEFYGEYSRFQDQTIDIYSDVV